MDRLFKLVPVIAPLAVVLALTFPVLALGVRFGWWSFQIVLPLLAGAALTAAVLLALAGISLLAALRRHLTSTARLAMLAILVLALPVGMVFYFGLKSGEVPVLYDVSTSWDQPPAIAVLSGVRPEGANPLQTAAENQAPQQGYYPDLVPLTLPGTLPDVMARVQQVASQLGWQVVAYMPDNVTGNATGNAANNGEHTGLLEATDTTFWFGFVDDITVRATALKTGGVVVDVRSVSRVGRSDLGKNADRIRRFLQAMQQ